VPHIGWNNVYTKDNEYNKFEGDYYFVHSFFCKPDSSEDVLFTSNYSIEFCTGVNKNNQIFGVQFHPEKSQTLGLQLLNHIISKCLKLD